MKPFMRSRFISSLNNQKKPFLPFAKIRLRPAFIPPWWRKVTDGTGLNSYTQKRDTQLVLDSQGIPFCNSRFRGQEHLYVPPLLEICARHELTIYASEKGIAQPKPVPLPVYKDCLLAAFFLLPLIFWFGLQKRWWPSPDFLPSPALWQDLGKIDAAKIIFFGEWHRIATSLTLHSALPHLFSNIAFGSLFLALLARVAGIGRAFFLTMLGGIAGNAISVLLHEANYQSIGFSTALFACIGILASITTARMSIRQKIFLPLAAAMALLAMLGTSGEHTDYLAHICGLGAGLGIGFFESFRLNHNWPGLPQFWAGLLGLVLLFVFWLPAFLLCK